MPTESYLELLSEQTGPSLHWWSRQNMKAWKLERIKRRTVLGSTCLHRKVFALSARRQCLGRLLSVPSMHCVTLSVVLCRLVANNTLSCLKEVQMPCRKKNPCFLLGEADTSLRLSSAQLFRTFQFPQHLSFLCKL